MPKLKTILFILVVGFLHLCCMFALIADRLARASCNLGPQTMCVTPATKIIEAILSFPFFTVIHLLGLDGHFPSLFIASLILNSLIAATFIWFITCRCLRLWQNVRN